MASRFRSMSKPAQSLFKSAISKPAPISFTPTPSLSSVSRSFRARRNLGCVESLLPLHSAVSSARLISCLSVDGTASRSLFQEMGLSVPR